MAISNSVIDKWGKSLGDLAESYGGFYVQTDFLDEEGISEEIADKYYGLVWDKLEEASQTNEDQYNVYFTDSANDGCLGYLSWNGSSIDYESIETNFDDGELGFLEFDDEAEQYFGDLSKKLEIRWSEIEEIVNVVAKELGLDD